MAKRTFASAAFLAFLLATSSQTVHADDGCDVLKEKVRTNVYASATEFARDNLVRRIDTSGQTGAVGSTLSGSQTCVNTAHATSRAFGEALATLGVAVMWTGSPMNPGDYCLSHDLSQCYPSQHPFNPSLPPIHVAFIYHAWTAVRKAVTSQMPFGTATGVSQFTPESLDAVLSSSLKTYLAHPVSNNRPFSRRLFAPGDGAGTATADILPGTARYNQL
jgi:hypothetical protein